jgi:threonine dehydratase
MAGNGTIALELLEDLADLDAVVVPWGGGGLACGIASVLRQKAPHVKIYAAEVHTGAPLSASLAAGEPRTVEHTPSFVDGISGRTVFSAMFAQARDLLDGSIVVTLNEAAKAMKLVAEQGKPAQEGPNSRK